MMLQKRLVISYLLSCVATRTASTFSPARQSTRDVTSLPMSSGDNDLPSIEQLSSDPFMKQVEYGFALATSLNENPESEELKASIKAQLSHSDGIRGFMVSYLTSEDSPADKESIPPSLLQALEEQLVMSADDLVPLTCMNVVMPTAMVSMHEDEEQSASSARTAQRGRRILQAFKTNAQVEENVKAILSVANGGDDSDQDASLIKYWTEFFTKWGYQEPQRADISKAMQEILQ